MLISHGQYSRGNLGKPVPECQTVLDSAAATDDGGGDVDNWRSKMCKAPVRSHNIAHFFYSCWTSPVQLSLPSLRGR